MGDSGEGSGGFRECAAGKRPGKEVWSLAVVTDKTHATDTVISSDTYTQCAIYYFCSVPSCCNSVLDVRNY